MSREQKSLLEIAIELLEKKKKPQPIDTIIKINASRLDIKLSNDSVSNNFLATEMDFKTVLRKNDKVVSVSEADIKRNTFKVLKPLNDPKTNAPSIPILNKGRWSGGEGWYYVCPCSFWRFNKDKCILKILKENGFVDKNIEYLPSRDVIDILKIVPEDLKRKIKSEANKIKNAIWAFLCGGTTAVIGQLLIEFYQEIFSLTNKDPLLPKVMIKFLTPNSW